MMMELLMASATLGQSLFMVTAQQLFTQVIEKAVQVATLVEDS